MISRNLTSTILNLSDKYQVLIITGPRQSGKTTLIQSIFQDLPYISFEEPDIRQLALNDPRGFLVEQGNQMILDEVQYVPDMLSYIQTLVDRDKEAFLVLSSSQNLLLMEKVSQSLAGRGAILNLLPFSYQELTLAGFAFDQYEEYLFKGQYPRIYDRDLQPTEFYPYYIQMYVERDVRQIKNIGDLNAFTRFLSLCAGRIGQIVNYNSLANDAGISLNTAKTWISVLETSFVLYLLNPYFKNYNKRIIKTPKLYFYDTGLACSLLGLRTANELINFYHKGALFENLIINELIKRNFNQGQHRFPYFWRDHTGHEIDVILDTGGILTPLEIKSGRTISENYFSNLRWWSNIVNQKINPGMVIYGGDQSLAVSSGQTISWKEIEKVPD